MHNPCPIDMLYMVLWGLGPPAQDSLDRSSQARSHQYAVSAFK